MYMKKYKKMWILLLGSIPFVVLGIVLRRHAFCLPYVGDSIFVVYIIASFLVWLLRVYNCKIEKQNTREDRLYYFFVKPVILECVCAGVVMPFLFGIPFLGMYITLGPFFINGAVLIVSIMQICLSYWIDRRQSKEPLNVLFEGIGCAIHAMLVTVTGSVLITVILRLVYGVMLYRRSVSKRDYGGGY